MTVVLKATCAVLGFAMLAMLAWPAAVFAQTAPPKPPYEEHDVPPQHFGPNGQLQTPADGGPSRGVLRPPATGDRNVVPPKNQSRTPTPTIPPPGTPGGNPNVQPK